jgi:Uncharacterized protein conserved in bacteria (DUF2332)
VVSTADKYRGFASSEARGESPCYQEWAEGVAADRELIGLIDALPEPKRQPNLLFAAARYIGIPPPAAAAGAARGGRVRGIVPVPGQVQLPVREPGPD